MIATIMTTMTKPMAIPAKPPAKVCRVDWSFCRSSKFCNRVAAFWFPNRFSIKFPFLSVTLSPEFKTLVYVFAALRVLIKYHSSGHTRIHVCWIVMDAAGRAWSEIRIPTGEQCSCSLVQQHVVGTIGTDHQIVVYVSISNSIYMMDLFRVLEVPA
jgi:hypothetical protein